MHNVTSLCIWSDISCLKKQRKQSLISYGLTTFYSATMCRELINSGSYHVHIAQRSCREYSSVHIRHNLYGGCERTIEPFDQTFAWKGFFEKPNKYSWLIFSSAHMDLNQINRTIFSDRQVAHPPPPTPTAVLESTQCIGLLHIIIRQCQKPQFSVFPSWLTARALALYWFSGSSCWLKCIH